MGERSESALLQLDSDLRRLVDLRHSDPHSVLGAHRVGPGTIFRAYFPDATQVVALVDGGIRISLHERRDIPGVFEGRTTGARPSNYRFEISYRGETMVVVRDPYAFLPTLGPQDLHFAAEGRHYHLWNRLGAHPIEHQGVRGTSFSVWAPNATGVSVVGDFNGWDGRTHMLRRVGESGVWEIFAPDVGEAAHYKFEIRTAQWGRLTLKADPLALRTEVPPATASVVHDIHHYHWGDDAWIAARAKANWLEKPMSIYELHLASWMHVPEDYDRPLTYREMAPKLIAHLRELGCTHVEFMPVAEHPFGGSWGYQVTSYYSPSARFGHPDDFRYLVDSLHKAGIGVFVDWVPGHFPRDAWALARFDGTALYEHDDPRRGEHPDWGTLIFNFGRNEVRNFLVANALFWIDAYHIDGLRVDAVASMLYLDYSRKPGDWIPNRHGGRENEEAIAFLRESNTAVQTRFPGVLMMAEESSAWPNVTHPAADGGLGFNLKWNLGWMHDTLKYFSIDPLNRKYYHNQLTFGMAYAYNENFILPLSHDEVVHGKKSLLEKMPGDEWQKFANLRALYGFMWAFPGKKLVFMGSELAMSAEWNNAHSLDWHLLERPLNGGVNRLMATLNRLYRAEPALWELDFSPAGFQWVQADSHDANVYAFIRRGKANHREVLCIANLSPVVRTGFQVGVPGTGVWREILNTDDSAFGGSGVKNAPQKPEDVTRDGQPARLTLTLPPLAVMWLMRSS